MPNSRYSGVFLFAPLMLQLSGADVDYLKEIKPVIKARCYACHAALKQKSGLRLDTVSSMHKGGEDGDILAAENSLLLQKVTAKDIHERMPPEGAALSADEIDKLKA